MAPEDLSALLNTSGVDGALWDREEWSDTYRISLTVIISLIILLTIIGNSLTLFVIFIDKQLRTIGNFYIASLAVADLLVGSVAMTFMMLYTVTFNGRWIFGHVICDIWQFVDYVACTASLTNVCAIALDRYLTVSRPLKAMRTRTKRRALIMIAVAWVIPVLFWMTMLSVSRGINDLPPAEKCYLSWKPDFLVLITIITMIYAPIVAIIVLFGSMMFVLWGHMNKMTTRFRNSLNRNPVDAAEESGNVRTQDSPFIKPSPETRVSCWIMGNRPGLDEASRSNKAMEFEDEARSRASGIELDDFGYVSTGTNTGLDCIDLYSEERFKDVATMTSPEVRRAGRTIGTNTSPFGSQEQLDLIVDNPQESFELKTLADESINVATCDESDCESYATYPTTPTPNTPCTIDSRFEFGPKLKKRLLQRRQTYGDILREERHSCLEKSRLRQQIKAAKTLGVIMAFLLICWLPLAIMWPIKTYCRGCFTQRIYDISYWSNYLNSTINPILYCLCNPRFQQAFQRILTRKAGRV